MSKRALIYIAFAIGLLYAIRAIEYAGVKRMEEGEFAKLSTTFEEENNFDLVIIGSSRAECQFYTPLIDSATGLNCYNIGMTGATLPFISATLKAYLVHSQAPQYVVLNLDLHSLGDNNDTVYSFARYFPFLDNEELYNGLQARDARFFWFKHLPFYSLPYFNGRYLSNSIHGWMGTPTQFDSDYEKGFAPSVGSLSLGDLDTATMIVTNAEIPQPVWDAVNEIHQLCKDKKIQLLFVVSPLHHRQEEAVKNYSQSMEKFRSFAESSGIPLIDLGHDSLRFEKEFYTDPAHLNKPGAVLFTRHFCSALSQYLGK